ncbi:MAG TPA: hypothetical protein VN948_21495 [Terriglobales bacterium]|nr:hypothetical protein [Terriglobales bacterium]
MRRPTARSEGTAGKRAAARISAALDKSLLSYAAAASAAGVGMLAMVQPAQAKIVYTAAHVKISPNEIVYLDLNHDGVRDFFFFFSAIAAKYGTGDGTLSVDPVRPNNRILGSKIYASALPPGVTVGPGGKFQREHDLMVGTGFFYAQYTTKGPWKSVQSGYLGLKFDIQGKTHFGWASFDVSVAIQGLPRVTATLTGYAYETRPDKPILTGAKADSDLTSKNSQPDPAVHGGPAVAPPSLGLLARGAAGLTIWRREEREGSSGGK